MCSEKRKALYRGSTPRQRLVSALQVKIVERTKKDRSVAQYSLKAVEEMTYSTQGTQII